jgi:predicted acyltransferase
MEGERVVFRRKAIEDGLPKEGAPGDDRGLLSQAAPATIGLLAGRIAARRVSQSTGESNKSPRSQSLGAGAF